MADNIAAIELGPTSFSIERPFTISVRITNSETRPDITFPDIPGFTRKGITTSVTTPDINEKNGINQIITQNYQARAPGRFVLAPFTIMISGEVLQSEGAVLIVRPSATASAPASATLAGAIPPANGAAFLMLRASKPVVYVGEGFGLTLSLFVADNYPYVLNFTALDKQLQAITKKIRPANAWEENRLISELKPVSVLVGGRKFREIQLYQSVFFPLSTRLLTLPAVTLQLLRPRPVIGPPSDQTETVAFTSKPVIITVRALPLHAMRGQVAVGSFRLNERLEQQRVKVGQSVRYGFTIEGEGNIATLPAPTAPTQAAQMDVFPPEERQTITHLGNQISGRKTFTYFVVPRQNGKLSLADYFQWVYFDPQRGRYDTLRPQLRVEAGGTNAVAMADPLVTANTAPDPVLGPSSDQSIYTGIKTLNSADQPVSIPVLIRAVANVLIVLMLLGMIFVFFKK